MPSLEYWLHSSGRVGRLRPGADAPWIGEIEVSVGVETCCTRSALSVVAYADRPPQRPCVDQNCND
jgi:hypothetical protein